MLDRRCWTFNRDSVSRSFALGLFIAFIPPTPLPVHLVACALLGVYFRLNLPVLIATVFVSNPFTWVPQVAGSLWVGAKLLGLDLIPFLRAISHHTLWADMGVLWPPLLLGNGLTRVADNPLEKIAKSELLAAVGLRFEVAQRLALLIGRR